MYASGEAGGLKEQSTETIMWDDGNFMCADLIEGARDWRLEMALQQRRRQPTTVTQREQAEMLARQREYIAECWQQAGRSGAPPEPRLVRGMSTCCVEGGKVCFGEGTSTEEIVETLRSWPSRP